MILNLFEPAPYHLTCEALVAFIPRQPFNTYSNIGYFLVASFLLLRGFRSGSSMLKKFGLLSFWVGCASVGAHALFVPFFNMIDYASIFFFVLFLAGQNAVIMSRLPFLRGFYGKFAVTLVYFGLELAHRLFAPTVFIASIFTFIVTEYRHSHRLPAALQAKFTRGAVAFCLAFVCLAVDLLPLFCAPDQHEFQWHGMWHFGSAVAIYLISQYYQGLESIGSLPNQG